MPTVLTLMFTLFALSAAGHVHPTVHRPRTQQQSWVVNHRKQQVQRCVNAGQAVALRLRGGGTFLGPPVAVKPSARPTLASRSRVAEARRERVLRAVNTAESIVLRLRGGAVPTLDCAARDPTCEIDAEPARS